MDPGLKKIKAGDILINIAKCLHLQKKEPEKIYFKNQPLPLIKYHNIINFIMTSTLASW